MWRCMLPKFSFHYQLLIWNAAMHVALNLTCLIIYNFVHYTRSNTAHFMNVRRTIVSNIYMECGVGGGTYCISFKYQLLTLLDDY